MYYSLLVSTAIISRWCAAAAARILKRPASIISYNKVVGRLPSLRFFFFSFFFISSFLSFASCRIFLSRKISLCIALGTSPSRSASTCHAALETSLDRSRSTSLFTAIFVSASNLTDDGFCVVVSPSSSERRRPPVVVVSLLKRDAMIRVDAVTANCAYVFSVSFWRIDRTNRSRIRSNVPSRFSTRNVAVVCAIDSEGERRGARNDDEGVVVVFRRVFPRE
jgi:hypothetical protein